MKLRSFTTKVSGTGKIRAASGAAAADAPASPLPNAPIPQVHTVDAMVAYRAED